MNVQALLVGAAGVFAARLVIAEFFTAQYLTAWAGIVGMGLAAALARRERVLHALGALGVYAIAWYAWRVFS